MSLHGIWCPTKKEEFLTKQWPKFDYENNPSSHQINNFTSPNQTFVAGSQPNYIKVTLKNFQIIVTDLFVEIILIHFV